MIHCINMNFRNSLVGDIYKKSFLTVEDDISLKSILVLLYQKQY